MIRNYQFYTVTGMSLEFHPKIFAPEATNTAYVRTIEIASEFGTLEVIGTPDNMKNFRDYKLYDPHGGKIRRFYNVGKYLRGIKKQWLSFGDEVDND